MLAALHRIEGDRDMVLPVCTYIYKVDVLAFAQASPRFGFASVCFYIHDALRGQPVRTSCDAVLFDVAESGDLTVRNIAQAVHSTAATHSQTDNSDSDSFQRLGCKTKHTFLSCRTLRDICSDDIDLLLAGNERHGCNQD